MAAFCQSPLEWPGPETEISALALEGAIHLPRGSNVEDFLHLAVHAVQPINGGCR
jgi:hypothetical protein